MDDAEVVRFAERRERLAQHVDDATKSQRPFFVGDARQVLAAQELHHEVGLAVVSATEVEDGDRVRMVQLARGARFGHEAERRIFIR